MPETFASVVELLRRWSKGSTEPESHRTDIVIGAVDLAAAVGALVKAHCGYLNAITGLNADDGGLEVLYHFSAGRQTLSLRVRPEANRVPSIAQIIPAAQILEWELGEMFGVQVQDGTFPVDKHLFLPDDWPVGVYPLRKGG